MKPPFTTIEPLETRIAPAAVLTLTDVDGDIVTITSSKGTNVEPDFVVSRTPAGTVGGVNIGTINLSNLSVFEGTNLSVLAKRGPLGGDGLVNVASIDAADDLGDGLDTALNLGAIVIDGNLLGFNAGKGQPGSLVKSLTVQSTSGDLAWDVRASMR